MRIGIIICLLFFTTLQSFGILLNAEFIDDSLNDDGGIVCIVDLDEDDEAVFVLEINELGAFCALFYQVIFKEASTCIYTSWIDPDCLDKYPLFNSSDTSPPNF